MLKIGIDIGSTTIKGVVVDQECQLLFSDYIRHNTLIKETLISLLTKVDDHFQNQTFQIAFTGSAGMGVAVHSNSLFIQEIVAAANLVKQKYPEIIIIIERNGTLHRI